MKGFNPALAVGIALPLLLIAALFAVLYLPSFFINPGYDFIYSNENPNAYNLEYKNGYVVKGGHIATEPRETRPNVTQKADFPTLYRYEVKTNTVHQIDFAEAQRLSIDPGPSSPDGYTVSYEYSSGGGLFLFGGYSSDGGYFVKKGSAAKRLSGIDNGSTYRYYSNGITVLGWVTK